MKKSTPISSTTPGYKKWDRGLKVFYVAMLALPLIQFFICYICVNFNSILLSFQEYDKLTGKTSFVGFDQFAELWRKFFDGTLWKAFGNSMKYFAINVFLVIPCTLMFSYYIFRRFTGGGFFKILLFLPNMVSGMIWVMFYYDLCEFGIPDMLVMMKGLSERPAGLLLETETAESMLIIFNVWMTMGSTMLLYLNAMTQISPSVIEAAELDGAGEARTFVSVILPSIWGTLVSFLVLQIAMIASNQASIFSFFASDGARVQTLGYYQFSLLYWYGQLRGPEAYPYAAAVGLFFTLIVAPVSLISKHFLLKYGPKEE